MSEHRLRAGRKVHRTLYEQAGDTASDTDTFIGSVDTPELAAEIVAGVNAAREADAGRPDPELERLSAQAADLSGAVWVHPGIRSGTPCVGGTRVPVEQVVSLMVNVPADEVCEDYPTVTEEGARAALAFANRFVDRRARPATETDPRTEVEAHAGGDPERIVQAWESDRAELRALVRDLADPDPCWHDHHGYCQAHGWFETDPPCPHGRAQRLAGEGPVDDE
ncbi:DUF433 domain-containing protein [Streptomonospora wellingtoniae]|uniref:DUF433 domain-containing protein n=1 Tax=Streptomonospora wellingtoniae TaxID=3075544 RepID=A0ABU2KUW7_9ACTN|nr:DUF433 domain-containing protein [Streptomonospora sp. DSM 45055]MDT0302923.1 DUF433 domain-containing protein [Streptomonospora sp. DSM 45055]